MIPVHRPIYRTCANNGIRLDHTTSMPYRADKIKKPCLPGIISRVQSDCNQNYSMSAIKKLENSAIGNF